MPVRPGEVDCNSGRCGRARTPARTGHQVLQLVDGAARGRDLLDGAPRETVCADGQRDGERALAEHLERLLGPHGACRGDLLRADLAAVGEEPPEVADVDDLVLHAEAVAEALELRQPHVQRHLAALEAGRHGLAGLRALGAATGGLAALAALAATHAGLGGLGALGGPQVVQADDLAHGLTSSTETRWRTVRIMPRICGVSGRSTD